jgi:hypothetical protein
MPTVAREEVPPGKRRAILAAYKRHAAEILKVWSEIHGRR